MRQPRYGELQTLLPDGRIAPWAYLWHKRADELAPLPHDPDWEDVAPVDPDPILRRRLWPLVESALSPRQSRVLRLRFVADLTLEEVGSAMGITRERVRLLELEALRKLRWKLRDLKDAH